VPVLSERSLAEVRHASQEPVSLRRALGCGLVVLSAVLASVLPVAFLAWWIGEAAGLAGGFLVGYDLAEDLVARLRDARAAGQPARLTRSERRRVASASISGPALYIPVLLVLAGVGAPAVLWAARASLGDPAASGWLWAVLLAVSAGLPGVQMGRLPWERSLAALRDGALDGKLRAGEA